MTLCQAMEKVPVTVILGVEPEDINTLSMELTETTKNRMEDIIRMVLGDYVIVHAGFAIKKPNEESAMETIRLLREAAAFVNNLEAGKG